MSTRSLPTRLDGAPLAVETRALVKEFGPGAPPALAGLDLQVPEGAVYVLAGPNGAGKSTAFRVLLDLVRADGGTARVLGMDTRAEAARVRAHLGYVPEVVETAFSWLTVRDFLAHHAAFFGAWDWAYAGRLRERLEIPPHTRLHDLSKGMLRRVALVTALAHRPPVLLLDEPTDGLDPLAREEVMETLIDHMAEAPTTVLWSTHHVHEVGRMGDHLGVMDRGQLVLQAPRDAVERRLRRYRAQVPDGWAGVSGMNGEVLRREGAGREIAWTVWGDEREVVERLSGAGATVRETAPLSLEDAALALLRAARAS
jgi:ABC-2 type transport system ATP-binding protein